MLVTRSILINQGGLVEILLLIQVVQGCVGEIFVKVVADLEVIKA